MGRPGRKKREKVRKAARKKGQGDRCQRKVQVREKLKGSGKTKKRKNVRRQDRWNARKKGGRSREIFRRKKEKKVKEKDEGGHGKKVREKIKACARDKDMERLGEYKGEGQ